MLVIHVGQTSLRMPRLDLCACPCPKRGPGVCFATQPHLACSRASCFRQPSKDKQHIFYNCHRDGIFKDECAQGGRTKKCCFIAPWKLGWKRFLNMFWLFSNTWPSLFPLHYLSLVYLSFSLSLTGTHARAHTHTHNFAPRQVNIQERRTAPLFPASHLHSNNNISFPSMNTDYFRLCLTHAKKSLSGKNYTCLISVQKTNEEYVIQ